MSLYLVLPYSLSLCSSINIVFGLYAVTDAKHLFPAQFILIIFLVPVLNQFLAVSKVASQAELS